MFGAIKDLSLRFCVPTCHRAIWCFVVCLGYSVDTKTVQKARAEIDKGHLLFVSGFYDSSEENGHAWIMDGYKKEVIYVNKQLEVYEN